MRKIFDNNNLIFKHDKHFKQIKVNKFLICCEFNKWTKVMDLSDLRPNSKKLSRVLLSVRDAVGWHLNGESAIDLPTAKLWLEQINILESVYTIVSEQTYDDLSSTGRLLTRLVRRLGGDLDDYQTAQGNSEVSRLFSV